MAGRWSHLCRLCNLQHRRLNAPSLSFSSSSSSSSSATTSTRTFALTTSVAEETTTIPSSTIFFSPSSLSSKRRQWRQTSATTTTLRRFSSSSGSNASSSTTAADAVAGSGDAVDGAASARACSSDDAAASSSSTASFGFKSVAENEKVRKVFEVFQNVSPKYDTMNDAMSLGIHRLWKDQFVRNLGPTPGSKVLDVAGGTGDVAFRILNSLLTAEDKEVLERSFDPVDPTVIVQKGIKDAMDIIDAAAQETFKADKEEVSSTAAAASTNDSNEEEEEEEEEDDLIDPTLSSQSPLRHRRVAEDVVNLRSAASMEAIRQKIDGISSSSDYFASNDFADFDEEEMEDEAEEGENPVEKGGLFLAGNIAGAKGQRISLSNFSDQRLAKVFKNDPHFVTADDDDDDHHDDDDDEEEDDVIVPAPTPDFMTSPPTGSPAASLDELLLMAASTTTDGEAADEDELKLDFGAAERSLEERALDNDDDVAMIMMTSGLHPDGNVVENLGADDGSGSSSSVDDSSSSSSSDDSSSDEDDAAATAIPRSVSKSRSPPPSTSSSTTGWAAAEAATREPKSLDAIFAGDPNVHEETLGVADLDLGIATNDDDSAVEGGGGGEGAAAPAAPADFDHRQLQVAPSYVDDTMAESSPDLPHFMSVVESGLGGFGLMSDEGMSHDEELNLEHELFENVLPSGGHVTVFDLSPKMLQEGKTKASSLGYTAGISWIEGDAEALPFPEDTFDAYSIAFGIRNCTRLDKVLAEAYRVLKPGGRFLCLEFSKVSNPVLRQLYDAYSFQLIPVMGEVIAGDWNSYQYLVESIRLFPDQEAFKALIEDAGFRMVQQIHRLLVHTCENREKKLYIINNKKDMNFI